jgi:hypothetical protein
MNPHQRRLGSQNVRRTIGENEWWMGLGLGLVLAATLAIAVRSHSAVSPVASVPVSNSLSKPVTQSVPDAAAQGATAYLGGHSASSSGRLASLGSLPADLIVPSELPANIEDPRLLEAWIRLYNYQDPIQLWNGGTHTGRELAHFVLDQAIRVVWDTENICQVGSCSVKHCLADTCTYEDETPGVEPIYVYPNNATDMHSLITTLAHEAFHRTLPFGAAKDTRFEEYWAFRISVKITKEVGWVFGAYDPLDPDQLNLWFRENHLDYYFTLPEYPASVAPLVDSACSRGDPFAGIPPEASGAGQKCSQ